MSHLQERIASMAKEPFSNEDKTTTSHKTKANEWTENSAIQSEASSPLAHLQRQIGNRAIQRLLAQRSGEGPFDLNDDTEARINRERGAGQTIDNAVQAKMSESTGHDFSGVRVHTSPESNAL